MEKHFLAAINNIISHGDTDIFPFPIENYIFYDCKDEVVKLLLEIHRDFDNYFAKYPPINESTLSPVGYTGFRWATQIDPIWNAYILGLVISIGEIIERIRVPIDKNVVFSYRFKYDEETHGIFDKGIGWSQFQTNSLRQAQKSNYVLICDISDFYSRIYHHRLENSLNKLGLRSNLPSSLSMNYGSQ